MNHKSFWCLVSLSLVVLTACKPSANPSAPGANTAGSASAGPVPVFSLAWSEYPSWSVFGVAHEMGLINGEAGQLGEIEKEFGVDIQLKEAGYDSCLNLFTSRDVDAVCMTNMDALIVSPQRSGVAVLPTSTSNGADACLVTEAITNLDGLKSHPVYGLANSVSQYCFARCLELAGKDEKDFTFTNMTPDSAAVSMQQRSAEHQAIMVWNPFVLQTLRERSDVRVLFDSSQIPGEIVDMVVVGTDVMSKPQADAFIKAVARTFYQVSEAIDAPGKGDEILVALGQKFARLGVDDMRLVVQQTQFYKTPKIAQELFASDEFRKRMVTVSDFCTKHGLVTDATVGYGAVGGEVRLRFDASHLTP